MLIHLSVMLINPINDNYHLLIYKNYNCNLYVKFSHQFF